VLVDSNGIVTSTPNTETAAKKTDESSGTSPASVDEGASRPSQNKDSKGRDKDDVFSDSEAEETGSSKSRQAEAASAARGTVINTTSSSETKTNSDQIASVSRETEHLSLGNTGPTQMHVDSERKSDGVGGAVPALEVPNTDSEFKAMAADASVFTFGDDEDFESE
jgi:phosphatidylinositol-3,4,5-trisphosphate 3-phosphatase/dual-specificity protein phosphatase PTEN